MKTKNQANQLQRPSRPVFSRRRFLKLASASIGGSILFTPRCSTESSAELYGHYDVVIIGGGISGLATAYFMRDRNLLVLEKENIAGGRIISGQWEGFHYPKGCEYTGEPEEEMADWFAALELTPVQVPPPTDAVAHNGSIYFGSSILDFLDSAGKTDYWDLQDELIELNNDGIEEAVFETPEDLADFAQLDSQSIAEWLQTNDYDSLVQSFVNIENRGLFGANNQLDFEQILLCAST